jgi:tRNA pseudouridine38-40 synthase
MEKCMSLKSGNNVELFAAGRTDAGVHAAKMTAHFDSDAEWNPKLIQQVNAFLPDDIAIHNIYSVTLQAHARFSALWRSYEYRITTKKNPFLTESAWYIHRELDIEAMKEAMSNLYNYTCFTSFSKLHSDNKTDNCKIIHAEIELRENHILVISLKADRFLRNMVRAITGTVTDVGHHKITTTQFCEIIEKRDRSLASMTAPAHGLYFMEAGYPPDIIMQD